MVITQLDVPGYPKIASDKRIGPKRRRSTEVAAPICCTWGDEQGRAEVDVESAISYSRLYHSTKNFVRTSYSRLKELGRFLSTEDCPQCRQYAAALDQQTANWPPVRQRFSDSFVEKVQAQQPNMSPCFSKKPPVEYYCTCVDPNSGVPYPPYKCVPYYSPDRTYRRSTLFSWLCCAPRRPKQHWQSCPCACHQRGESYRPMRQYRGVPHGMRYSDRELMQEPMVSGYAHRPQYPQYGKEPQQGPVGPKPYRRPPATAECIRPRTRHSSIEYMKMEYAESEEDVGGGEGFDCCCCCPCLRDYQTADVQTEDVSKQPKHMDTQTEAKDRSRRKRRCCKCCRDACARCARDTARQKPEAKMSPREMVASPLAKKCHTVICKSVAMQHSPEPPSYLTSLDEGACSCTDPYDRHLAYMRNPKVFCNRVKPNQAFLDKIYQNQMLSKTLCSLPRVTSFPPFIGQEDFLHPASAVLSNSSSHMVVKKSKKKLLSAVCDSILGDLGSRRHFSVVDSAKSPDSGFQDVKPCKNLFSRRKLRGRTAQIDGWMESQDHQSLDSIINLLKDDRKPQTDSDVIGEASVMVRNILEDISSKDTPSEGKEDLLHSETLRNMLLKTAKSDSAVGVPLTLPTLGLGLESNQNSSSQGIGVIGPNQ